MSDWIDVSNTLPQPNTVVLGMATTVDFAGKAFPATVGLDPSRGWVTWPSLELCYVFFWMHITTPSGEKVRMFIEEEKQDGME